MAEKNSRPRLLVVKNSPMHAKKHQIVLESAGYEGKTAHGGESGLELVDASYSDLVMSDVFLPGMSGYYLCREIKEHPAKSNVPVVLLTTLSDATDILDGLPAGDSRSIPTGGTFSTFCSSPARTSPVPGKENMESS